MPPHLYPIVHRPSPSKKYYLNDKKEEHIPLKIFYVPENEMFVSCLSKKLMELDLDEKEKKKKLNKRDEFMFKKNNIM